MSVKIEDKISNVFGLTVFNSEQFGKLRIARINDEDTFNLSDVCFGLGYTKKNSAGKTYLRKDEIENICETLDIMGVSDGDTKYSITKTIDFENTYISEDAFYDLCLESKAKHARSFRKWVTLDVLPSIRKHGCFIGEKADIAYIDNELRFSTKRTIKTFAQAKVSELNSLYEEFKAYMTSEYKSRTDIRIARYKSVEKGLEQLHDSIAKEDIANIGNCYNIRKLKEQVILDRTKLEKKSLGGDKAGKTKKIMALQDRLDFLDPDIDDFNMIPCHGFSTNYLTEIGQDYVTGEPKKVTSKEYRKWQDNFPNSEFDEEIDIDWNGKIYLWLRFDALEKFDADNMIKSFQDQICRFYGTDDNNIEIREATINKNVTEYRDGRIYYILRNAGEVQ